MKIDKISDDTVTIIVTASDLQERDISLGELTFGSPKAQELFREVLSQAYDQYGFDADGQQLVIKAFGLSLDSFMIVVTKVNTDNSKTGHESETEFEEAEVDEETFDDLLDDSDEYDEDSDRQDSEEEDEQSGAYPLIYSFKKLDEVGLLAREIARFENSFCSLYKYKSKYYLVLKVEAGTPGEERSDTFARAVIGEYGSRERCSESFLGEHGDPIMTDVPVDFFVKYI